MVKKGEQFKINFEAASGLPEVLSAAEIQAIAHKYKVNNLKLIEKKNGQILINGMTPEEWESLNDVSDLPHYKGQR